MAGIEEMIRLSEFMGKQNAPEPPRENDFNKFVKTAESMSNTIIAGKEKRLAMAAKMLAMQQAQLKVEALKKNKDLYDRLTGDFFTKTPESNIPEEKFITDKSAKTRIGDMIGGYPFKAQFNPEGVTLEVADEASSRRAGGGSGSATTDDILKIATSWAKSEEMSKMKRDKNLMEKYLNPSAVPALETIQKYIPSAKEYYNTGEYTGLAKNIQAYDKQSVLKKAEQEVKQLVSEYTTNGMKQEEAEAKAYAIVKAKYKDEL